MDKQKAIDALIEAGNALALVSETGAWRFVDKWREALDDYIASENAYPHQWEDSDICAECNHLGADHYCEREVGPGTCDDDYCYGCDRNQGSHHVFQPQKNRESF